VCSSDLAEPVEPVGPVAPVAPGVPAAPGAPFSPGVPGVPAAPVAPAGPVAPIAPVAPIVPVEPGAPPGPVGPWRPRAAGSTCVSFRLHALRAKIAPLFVWHTTAASARVAPKPMLVDAQTTVAKTNREAILVPMRSPFAGAR